MLELGYIEILGTIPCKKPKLKYLLIQDTYVCAFAQFELEELKMKVRINVTQKDIDGYRKTIVNRTSHGLTDCAVARACKHNSKIKTIFGHVGIVFLHLEGMPTVRLCSKVSKNILDIFNFTKIVKPFSFTIEVPECLMK